MAEKGARAQATGPSRGGQTTKNHLTDLVGHPAVIRLTAGDVSDIHAVDALIAAAGPVRRLLADKGYDAEHLRKHLRQAGTVPIVPGRSNRKLAIRYDKRRYRDRWRIEAAFCRVKDFRRIATRYDTPARNFLSAIALVVVVAFWV